MSFLKRLFAVGSIAPRELSLVGRSGVVRILGLTALAVTLIGLLEADSGVLRTTDRFMYPALVVTALVVAFAVATHRMGHVTGLRMLSGIGALYLGLSVTGELIAGQLPSVYDIATLTPWMMMAQVILYATYPARVAMMVSTALTVSLAPLLLWPMPAPLAAQIHPLAANGMLSLSLITCLLYVVAVLLGRLVRVDHGGAEGAQPITVQELTLKRMQERRRLQSLAARADAAAREQERELLAMLRAFPGHVVRVDAEGRITHANAPMAASLGRTTDQLVGLHLRELIGEEDHAEVERCRRTIQASGQPQVFERRQLRPDGSALTLLATQFSVPDASGNPTAAFYQVGLDVTEMRQTRRALEQSLAQLDALFEALPLATALLDVDDRHLRVNRAYGELFGMPPARIIGRPVRELVDQDIASSVPPHQGAEAGGRRVQRDAVTRSDPTGRVQELILHRAGVYTADGEYTGRVVSLFDVTEINTASRMVDEARAAAESANAAKSAFLATMSHEIRTPLNGVIGMAEVLLHQIPEGEQARSVRIMRDSALSLLDLLDGILDFSKIEAGKLELHKVALAPRALLDSVAAVLQPGATTRGVAVHLHVDDDVPAWILGDEMRLRQVVNNLLSNAIKFSASQPQRQCQVRVRLSAQAKLMRLEVSDNGIGMDLATQQRLFEPFVQAEASTTRRFGGTGLGLAITRRLVELMDGQISVSSSPGEGASFVVAWPWQPAASPDAALQTPAPGQPRPAVLGDSASRRILVAEDEPVNREVLLRQLELLGYAAEVALDGEQALARWREGGYDLVLTDLHMPLLDGYALASRIRAEEAARAAERHTVLQRVPILAVTANALKGEEAQALAAGMDAYLTKPIRMQELQAALNRWLVVRPAELAEPAGRAAASSADGREFSLGS